VAYGGAYGLDLSFGGGIPADLDALFDQTKSLAATPRTITELPGGLTNRNYKVATPDGTFVARISSGGSELLAIDRDCEYRNSVTAAAAGAGAPVVEYRPQDRLLVIGYLEGRTYGAADVAAHENIPRIADACRGSTTAPGSATTSTCSTSSAATCRWPGPAASDPSRLRRPAAAVQRGGEGPGGARRGHRAV
jgi:Phosphotransferase enzyme family.